MDVHKTNKQKIVEYFRHLGFSTDETEIYLHLLHTGPQTVLALSKGLSSGRTRLYPILETLTKKGLIISHNRHYGTIYDSMPIEKIGLLITQSEAKITKLRAGLPLITDTLSELAAESPVYANNKVSYINGIDSIKDCLWNAANSSKSNISGTKTRLIMPRAIEKQLDAYYLKKFNGAIHFNNQFYYLTNQRRLPSSLTNMSGYQLDDAKFSINQFLLVYNSVVVMTDDSNEVSGSIIQNPYLANMQTALFDYLRSQSTQLNH